MIRWSETGAVEYLIRVTGIQRSKAEDYVSRIVTFPGRAVAPEYGNLKLQSLRNAARLALGL